MIIAMLRNLFAKPDRLPPGYYRNPLIGAPIPPNPGFYTTDGGREVREVEGGRLICEVPLDWVTDWNSERYVEADDAAWLIAKALDAAGLRLP